MCKYHFGATLLGHKRKYQNISSMSFRFVTNYACDRRMDRITIPRPCQHSQNQIRCNHSYNQKSSILFFETRFDVVGVQMAEDKEAFEKDCEIRRSDLQRIQNKRIQEFDLLTTTAGLDLIHIVQATEPNTPVEVVPSDSPAKCVLQPENRASSGLVMSSGVSSDPSSRVVPQYVQVVTPRTKPSPDKLPTPETTRL